MIDPKEVWWWKVEYTGRWAEGPACDICGEPVLGGEIATLAYGFIDEGKTLIKAHWHHIPMQEVNLKGDIAWSLSRSPLGPYENARCVFCYRAMQEGESSLRGSLYVKGGSLGMRIDCCEACGPIKLNPPPFKVAVFETPAVRP